MAVTTYQVVVEYMLQDRATKGMRSMESQAKRTANTTGRLAIMLKRAGMAAGAFFGIRAAKGALIDFNASMEQAKIQMGGMIMLTTRGTWQASLAKSNELVRNLQQHAEASVGTTKDMVDMASMIARPVLAAGFEMKQLGDLTAAAVVASRAFGIEAGMAARDIEGALMGQLRSVDRFSRALLEPLGYVGEKGRKAFNEMAAGMRAATLKKALGGEAISAMAKAQEQSFSGVISTFQDSLQIALGRVGLPLFKALTAEVRNWNVWLKNNEKVIVSFAKELGSVFKDIFGMLKSVASFFAQHSTLLLTIAKALLAVRIGRMAGGLVAGAAGLGGRVTKRAGAGMLMAGADRAGLSVAKFGAGIATAGAAVARIAPVAALAILGLKGIHDWWKSAERERTARRLAKIAIERGKMARFRLPETDPEYARLTARERFTTTRAAPTSTESLRQLRRLVGEAPMALPAPGAPGEALKIEQAPWYLNLIQRAQEVERIAPGIQETYRSVADAAIKGGLIQEGVTDLTTFTHEQIAEAAKQAAASLGVGSDQIGALRGKFEWLIKTLDQSKDATKTFAAMLESKFVPEQLKAARALMAMLSAKPETEAERKARLALTDKTGKRPRINVTINRIEVQSEDPDRFVFGMVSAIKDAVRNPSSDIAQFQEG